MHVDVDGRGLTLRSRSPDTRNERARGGDDDLLELHLDNGVD